MARLFISYKREEQDYAFAIRQWLIDVQGWLAEDIFVDVGHLHAGDEWERKLLDEAEAAEAMLFLASAKSLDIHSFCYRELQHANGQILAVTIKGIVPDDERLRRAIPNHAKSRQVTALDKQPTEPFRFVSPVNNTNGSAQLNAVEVASIGRVLRDLGVAPNSFSWTPTGAGPYPGLRPLMEGDEALLFGRDIEIRNALKALELLRESVRQRALLIQAPSGAGKSSLLRAGLWPRLRNHAGFTPLGILRAAKGVVRNAEWGLVTALTDQRANYLKLTRDEIETGIRDDLAGLLAAIADKDRAEDGRRTLLLGLDQGEEMAALSAAEDRELDDLLARLLALPRDLDLRLVLTARDDSVDTTLDRLAKAGLPHEKVTTWRLDRLPVTRFRDVIAGPAAAARRADWPLHVDDALVDALATAAGGAMSEFGDALPILALALQRMVARRRTPDGRITLKPEEARGFIEKAIEEAAADAIKAAGAEQDDLRRPIIPSLATWDPKAGSDGAAKRQVASATDLFAGPRAGLGKLADALVAQRLLTRSRSEDGAAYEIAHEALLRVPPLGQLIYERRERFDQVRVLEMEAREWYAAGRVAGRLGRAGDRLDEARKLLADEDFGPGLGRKQPSVADYLAACADRERKARTRAWQLQTSIYTLLAAIIAGLLGWINQASIKERANWFLTMRPYMQKQVLPYVLTPEAEAALKPGDAFHECATDCPVMVVVPPGEFMMGSAETEAGRYDDEGPRHKVTIAKAFAVSSFDVTFADWDACVAVGGCPLVSDSGIGRDTKPVINVTWDEARHYADWLSTMTGRPYRLLTEAEWEYAARAGTTTAYYWGGEIGKGNANCNGCGSRWDARQTSPVGSFAPNAFGLYDMAGNVWQWVENCYQDNYNEVPTDGSAPAIQDCGRRVVRGGSWLSSPRGLRAAVRIWDSPGVRNDLLGFRLARTLSP